MPRRHQNGRIQRIACKPATEDHKRPQQEIWQTRKFRLQQRRQPFSFTKTRRVACISYMNVVCITIICVQVPEWNDSFMNWEHA